MSNRAFEFGHKSERRDDEYHAWLDRLVVAARRRGVDRFGSLVRELPGVYPSEVRASLRRIGERELDSEPRALVVRRFWGSREPETADHGPALPIPHPLDLDWRFDLPTRKLLFNRSRRLAEQGELVCLGTPTVFFAAVTTGASTVPVLLDSDAAIRAALPRYADRILPFDVAGSDVPDLRASAIVADPPWYPDYMFAFMWVARQMMAQGAHLLMTLPPVGTRPGIVEERHALLAWAEALGLTRMHLESGAVRYISPLYEWNALRADRLGGVPLDWRAGDLAVFRCIAQGQQPPRPTIRGIAPTWREVELRGVRVRVRAPQRNEVCAPALLPLVAGDVLPSISRRDPRRAGADVWTSGNRVFACRSPGILAEVAIGLATGESALERVARSLGRQPTLQEVLTLDGCYRQLRRLVDTECRDRLHYESALRTLRDAFQHAGE
jgi:hypothetical protein